MFYRMTKKTDDFQETAWDILNHSDFYMVAQIGSDSLQFC